MSASSRTVYYALVPKHEAKEPEEQSFAEDVFDLSVLRNLGDDLVVSQFKQVALSSSDSMIAGAQYYYVMFADKISHLVESDPSGTRFIPQEKLRNIKNSAIEYAARYVSANDLSMELAAATTDLNKINQLLDAYYSCQLGHAITEDTNRKVVDWVRTIQSYFMEKRSGSYEEKTTLYSSFKDRATFLIHQFDVLKEYVEDNGVGLDEDSIFLDFVDLDTIRNFLIDQLLQNIPAHLKQRRELPTLTFTANGLIQDKSVDLYEFPLTHGIQLTASDVLIIGDLHGNFLYLLNFLIRENVIKGIDANDYEDLGEIHYACVEDDLTEENLSDFDDIIEKIVAANDHSPLVLFLGDVGNDRYGCDLLTFRALRKISQLTIPYFIFTGNHDHGLICLYEKGYLTEPTLIDKFVREKGTWQFSSARRWARLLNQGLATVSEVTELMETVFLPSLILAYFSEDKQNRQLFLGTHTPSNLDFLPRVAEQLRCAHNYAGKTPYTNDTLMNCTTAINQQLQLFLRAGIYSALSADEDSLFDFVWERYTPNLQMYLQTIAGEQIASHYALFRFHGHDGEAGVWNNNRRTIVNLNNLLGMDSEHSKGNYMVYYMGNNLQFLSERAKVRKTQEKSIAVQVYQTVSAVSATVTSVASTMYSAVKSGLSKKLIESKDPDDELDFNFELDLSGSGSEKTDVASVRKGIT